MSAHVDRGSVTAEFAVTLPVIVLVIALGAAVLAACGRQVRLQDVAADAARLVARGEPAVRADAVVAQAVAGATVAFSEHGGLVCAAVTAPAHLPVPLPVPLPGLRASSCALGGGR